MARQRQQEISLPRSKRSCSHWFMLFKSFAEGTHRVVSFGVTYSQHPASALGTLDYQMSVGEVD